MTTTTIKQLAVSWAEDLQTMGFKQGWMLVVHDLHTQQDFPAHVYETEDIREVVREYARVGAEEVLEIYDLSQPIEPQAAEAKAWNW